MQRLTLAIAQPATRAVNTSLLLKTGQTTSYGSGTGVDDGALKKGVARSYTVLTSGQYAGTTNIVVNGKTCVKSNACVQDNNTGLMWTQSPSASVGPASDGKLPWTTTGAGATAEGIFPYAAAANAAQLAGYSDWRIPNVFEQMSLEDYEAPTSYPDGTAFPSPAATAWTSTTQTNVTTNAFMQNLANGQTSPSAKTGTNQVYLVRGGNP